MLVLTSVTKILIVVTSFGRIDADHQTGIWLEEFSVPYQIFSDAGYTITVASPEGGKAPVDPRSMTDQTKPEHADQALNLLAQTLPLKEIDLSQYDAVFFPGGHGTMFDLPDSKPVIKTVEHFLNKDLPVGLVCHGPAALVNARNGKGEPAVKGRKVAAFTDAEEKATGLAPLMPFLLQSRLEKLGATVKTADNFQENVVVDKNLVTGQNPASSHLTAKKLVDVLEQHKKTPRKTD